MSKTKRGDFISILCETCREYRKVSRGNVENVLMGRYNSPRRNSKDWLRQCKLCRNGRLYVKCNNCDAKFRKLRNQSKKFPNHFCSSSCAATYNNKNNRLNNKRRSKAEHYLEEQLSALGYQVESNRRDIVPSGLEIDIYLPNENIAIELNGPVHYQPIYGEQKFNDIVRKDAIKASELRDLDIPLYVIDVSQNRFDQTRKVLDEFVNRMAPEVGYAPT